jgi:hypothetical protein
MNIGGFKNRQIPFSVFRSRPHPHFLSPPSLAHTPLPLPLTRPSVPPPCPARCLLSRSARRLLAHPTVGAASLPGLLPPHSLSPPPPCSPGRRCRLLTQPAASSLTSARPPPPGHRPSPPGHCSWRSRATAARCHHRHRCPEGHLLLSQPPRLAPTARPPTPRGPPPICRP